MNMTPPETGFLMVRHPESDARTLPNCLVWQRLGTNWRLSLDEFGIASRNQTKDDGRTRKGQRNGWQGNGAKAQNGHGNDCHRNGLPSSSSHSSAKHSPANASFA